MTSPSWRPAENTLKRNHARGLRRHTQDWLTSAPIYRSFSRSRPNTTSGFIAQCRTGLDRLAAAPIFIEFGAPKAHQEHYPNSVVTRLIFGTTILEKLCFGCLTVSHLAVRRHRKLT